MITTLNDNYKKNIEILKENLKRGMKKDQVAQVIQAQKEQFIKAGLYNEAEKNYIIELTKEALAHFTKINITIIK